MKYQFLAFSLIFLFCFSCKTGEYFENAYCITDVSVFDSESGLQPGMTIVVRGDRIVKKVKSADLSLSSKNKIIDGKDKFLIPGLWDAHVHFAFIEELAPKMFDLFLGYGVTSVRDTGGKIDFLKKWKKKAEADPTAAPRVKIAGPLLDGMPNVYDGSSPGRPPLSVGLATPEAAVQMVDSLAAQGVDLLKAYEMLTPEQFKAITKRAREIGLKVTGHVPLSMDVITAAEAGMNCMEHLRNVEMSTAAKTDDFLKMRRKLLEAGTNEQGGVLRANIHKAQRSEAIGNQDEEETEQVIAALANNKVWQCPTFSIMTASVERFFATEEWKNSFDYLPESVAEKWSEGLNGFLKTDPDTDRQKYADWMFGILEKINDAEVGILAGTDCPIFYLTPGLSLHGELELMVKAGMTPGEVLEAATINPAKFFDMEKELGLISEGFFADLVLLNANPLESISNTKKIEAVFRNGRYYDRTDLDEMLNR